jgi:tRNA threonylcarbamoyladenosine biosynthesis protein TsaB
MVRSTDGHEASEEFPAGRRDQDSLLPAIDRVVEKIGLAPAQLDVLAVNIGPGGFTGLRISIATIQGIAEMSEAQIVGVPGAVVAAAATPDSQSIDGEVLVLLASKGETAWGTRVRCRDGHWEVQGSPGLLQGFDEALPSLALGDEHLPEKLRDDLAAAGVRVVPPMFSAGAVLEQGLFDLEAGKTIEPAVLAPLYPREPEAVRIWREIR